jgi:hypothetical protein
VQRGHGEHEEYHPARQEDRAASSAASS